MKKGTKLYGILKCKCPRCQQGNLFSNQGLLAFSRALEMPDECSHCGQDFKLEPGFYTLALWISYPILMIILAPIIIVLITYPELRSFTPFFYLIAIAILVSIQVPLMRISRAIAIHMFIPYDNKYDTKDIRR